MKIFLHRLKQLHLFLCIILCWNNLHVWIQFCFKNGFKRLYSVILKLLAFYLFGSLNSHHSIEENIFSISLIQGWIHLPMSQFQIQASFCLALRLKKRSFSARHDHFNIESIIYICWETSWYQTIFLQK